LLVQGASWLAGKAACGLAEELHGKVEGIEVGLVAGGDVLDGAAQNGVVRVVFRPEADEEALSFMRVTGH
jgi:hypothetical protein